MAKATDRIPEYFKNDEFFVTGMHKDYVDKLWTQNKIQESYFRRLVDLYCVAAAVGLLANRRSEPDNSTPEKRTVQLMQITECYQTLIQLMRLVLILDETRGLDADERVRSAFRAPASREEYEANMELFNSYARGGIEILYERLVIRNGNSSEDEFEDERVNNIVALLNNPPSTDEI